MSVDVDIGLGVDVDMVADVDMVVVGLFIVVPPLTPAVYTCMHRQVIACQITQMSNQIQLTCFFANDLQRCAMCSMQLRMWRCIRLWVYN